ncbi:MAG: glycine cleavage system protein GcvH [Deltaproteobacteria bacterium]|nr:glycine cleavage system protein GcvH [Deltaproteobacteria bacterium]
MSVPADLLFTKDHEWARIEGDTARIGVTHYAQDSLGEIVFVELPEVGRTIAAGGTFGSVESVKAVSDLFAPLSGVVAAVNKALVDTPETVNRDPYGDGWMIQVKLSDPAETAALLAPADYEKLLSEES